MLGKKVIFNFKIKAILPVFFHGNFQGNFYGNWGCYNFHGIFALQMFEAQIRQFSVAFTKKFWNLDFLKEFFKAFLQF